MPLTLVQTVAPTSEPVTLAEAKLHLRQDVTDDDNLIAGLIAAARRAVENYTGRQLVVATWRQSSDQFPYYEGSGGRGMAFTAGLPGYSPFAAYAAYGAIRLAKSPSLNNASLAITYIDTTQYNQNPQAPTTLASTLYRVDTDTEPARITPSYGNIWPVALAETNAVQVTYQAGYAVTAIAGSISAGSQVVTPASMAGIAVGTALAIDVGASREIVTVSAVASTTFTATFALAHTGPVAVNAVPEDLRTAIFMIVANLYENRGDTPNGLSPNVCWLLEPWRCFWEF